MLRIFRAKPLASLPGSKPKGPTRPLRRGPLTLLIAPAALIATLAFACDDEDKTITDGNGGSGGGGGSAGSGGGSSGSAGTGGSAGTAGSAGTGGGAGTAGTGGSGGTGGTAGTAGTGGTGEPLDGGVVDGGDSGGPQPLTQAEAAAAICVRLDEVASCAAPADPCADGIISGWDFFKSTYPNCATIVDDYFNCMAGEPVTSYACDANSPITPTPQTGACADEDAAFQPVQSGDAPCAQP